MSGWRLLDGIVWYRCSMLGMQEQIPLDAYATAGEVDTDFSNQGGIGQRREAQCRER